MRNFLVHIGYHKTGTTWFQKKYFDKSPEAFRINRRFIRDALVKPRSLDFDAKFCRSNIEKEITNVKKKMYVVLSEEELSGNPHTAGKGGYAEKELADRLYRVFKDDNAVIIIFIRNQKSMIESTYNQYVKRGGTNSIKRYLFPPKIGWRRDLFDFSYFEYDKLISYFIQLFGREKVKVFLYEEFKQKGDDFIKEFSDALGLMYCDDLFKVNENVNLSIPTYGVPILRWTNSISRVSDLNSENMINIPKLSIGLKILLQRLPRGRNKDNLSQENIKFIIDYYRKSNNNLAKVCGIDTKKLKNYNYSV